MACGAASLNLMSGLWKVGIQLMEQLLQAA